MTENWISFPNIGEGITFNLNPTAFTVGGFDVKWRYILSIIAAVVGLLLLFRSAKKSGADSKEFLKCMAFTAACAVLGGRLFYSVPTALLYKHDAELIFRVSKALYENVWQAINIFDGGMIFFGGLLFGIVGGAIWLGMRHKKTLFGEFSDSVAYALPLGQAVYALGLFTDQTGFGAHSNSFLAINGSGIETLVNALRRFDIDAGGAAIGPNVRWVVGNPVAPCVLIETLVCVLIFALIVLLKRFKTYKGESFVLYVFMYSLLRSFTDAERVDVVTIGDARLTQILALIAAFVSLVVEIILRWQVKEGRLSAVSLYIDPHKNDGFEKEVFAQKVFKCETDQTTDSDAEQEVVPETEPETEQSEYGSEEFRKLDTPDLSSAGMVWTSSGSDADGSDTDDAGSAGDTDGKEEKNGNDN